MEYFPRDPFRAWLRTTTLKRFKDAHTKGHFIKRFHFLFHVSFVNIFVFEIPLSVVHEFVFQSSNALESPVYGGTENLYPGVLPYISYIGMCRPKGYDF